MRRSASEKSNDSPKGGLLYGIGCWHVRVLCDNAWEGGRGYTPNQVGEFTLDQVLMLLTDRKILMGKRDQGMEPLTVAGMASKDGAIRGRDKDGNPIVGRIAGKSKARQLMEAADARKALEQKNRTSRRERRRMK